jgi:hypothetical protein
MSFNLNLTDGKSHEVTLYADDFDGLNRAEQIQIVDAATGVVLNTQTLTMFTAGEYVSWSISGHVLINVINLNPSANAVASGIFFGAKPVGSSASFLGTDTTTSGAWRNAYGVDGYDINSDTSAGNPKLPSYATLSVTGAQSYVWTSLATDPRALQNAAATGSIASAWYTSSTMTFAVNVTDGKSHEVSLYTDDFDSHNRVEQIQINDAATGSVLSTQTINSFVGGEYLSWTISGNVVITVTNLNPNANAVVSGIFFGGKASASSASFVGTNTTTQGAWHGVYGADGYDINSDTSPSNPKVPSYASLSITGTQSYVWTNLATDPRALQNAANNGSIASAWYSAGTMSFSLNLTDGNVHKVTLYAADFDNHGRSEQIQIVDAATGAVLSTQTISAFQNGEYLSWNVSGNVVIKVTNLNPNANAVVSGLFFG